MAEIVHGRHGHKGHQKGGMISHVFLSMSFWERPQSPHPEVQEGGEGES